MATTTVALPARVAAVLATASTWTAGRRKADGKPFFFIPSACSSAVYMTAVDGCTCMAAQNSRTGDCKHQAAVRQHSVTVAPVLSLKSYRSLFPGCANGCGELVERDGSFCYECCAKETYRLDRERQARKGAA